MKKCIYLMIGVGMLVGGTLSAKEIKKPVDVYLRTAKIEIIEGRLDSAETYLNHLFEFYGPHAEGLYWMAQIKVDFIEKASGPYAKEGYVKELVAYIDSLESCCANEDIKKKYREKCDDYIGIADSLLVKYWRQFFNDGLVQFQFAEKIKTDMAAAEDSSIRAQMQTDINVNLDTCIQNMSMAITCIPDSSRTYLIIDKAYTLQGEYEKGIEWLKKAYAYSNDSLTIQQSLAFNYIQIDDYCGAIPYYRDILATYREKVADKSVQVPILFNLSICYNRCEQSDSAATLYAQILEIDPGNVDILTMMGRNHNTRARLAADSAAYFANQSNDTQANLWTSKKNEAFDSARVYFGRAFAADSTNIEAAEMYAVTNALLGDHTMAAVAFARLTQLQPDIANHWIYLGDSYVSLSQFEKAAAAYEKVVELEPGNASIWGQLVELYREIKQPEKKAQAEKKLQELK